MLGLGRASEYAGWWSSQSPVWASMTTTALAETPNHISPRYYSDFSAATTVGTGGTAGIASITSGSTVIDLTSLGSTEGKRQTHALTFKVGSNWVPTPQSSYTRAFGNYQQFYQSGVQTNYYTYGGSQSGNYIFGFTIDQFLPITLTSTQMNTYRNKWLGLVCSTSDSTSSFANWTGTGSNTYNFCCRTYLIDLETNTVISTLDNYAYASKPAIDLTQTWYASSAGSPTYYNDRILLLGTATTLTSGDTDFKMLSDWMCIGSTLDPSVWWPYLVGDGIGDTVNNVRAWSTSRYTGSGTAVVGTYGTYGYDLGLSGSYCWPANTNWEIVCSATQNPPTAPTFVSY
jgi:hypothetical protein